MYKKQQMITDKWLHKLYKWTRHVNVTSFKLCCHNSLSLHDAKYYVKYLKMCMTCIHDANVMIDIVLRFMEDISVVIYGRSTIDSLDKLVKC